MIETIKSVVKTRKTSLPASHLHFFLLGSWLKEVKIYLNKLIIQVELINMDKIKSPK